MGKLFVFVGLLISTFSFACSCDYGTFGENFANNDFVAEIEILKTYDVNFKIGNDNRFYKADIKILKLYKGKLISSIILARRVGKPDIGNCEIEVKKGDKFLVYLNSKNKYIMYYCSPRKYLNNENINVERKALEFLIKKNISNSNCFYSVGNHFEKFKSLNPKNDFAVYKLKINSKSKIESISAIQDFGTSKDSEIKNTIKTNFKMVRGFRKEIKNEEVTLVLFFDKKNRFVISPVNSRL